MGGRSQNLDLTGLTVTSRSEMRSTNPFRFHDLPYDIRLHLYGLILLSEGEIHLDRKEECAHDVGDPND